MAVIQTWINEKCLTKSVISEYRFKSKQEKGYPTHTHTHTLAFNHEQVACSHLVAISGNKVTWMSTFSSTVWNHSWEHPSPAATARLTVASDQRSNEWCPLQNEGQLTKCKRQLSSTGHIPAAGWWCGDVYVGGGHTGKVQFRWDWDGPQSLSNLMELTVVLMAPPR